MLLKTFTYCQTSRSIRPVEHQIHLEHPSRDKPIHLLGMRCGSYLIRNYRTVPAKTIWYKYENGKIRIPNELMFEKSWVLYTLFAKWDCILWAGISLESEHAEEHMTCCAHCLPMMDESELLYWFLPAAKDEIFNHSWMVKLHINYILLIIYRRELIFICWLWEMCSTLYWQTEERGKRDAKNWF